MIKIAFTKTSNPIWYIDDTPANVAAQLLAEGLTKEHIMCVATSGTSGQIIVIVRKSGLI